MKNRFLVSLLRGLLLVALATPMWAAASAPTPINARDIRIENPSRNVGLTIGDVLTRTVSVDLPPGFRIAKSALPQKGSQQQGIELVDVKLEEKSAGKGMHYTLTLRYQIFAHRTQPSVLQLPAETIAATGDKQAVTIPVPAWRFWLSPLAASTMASAKANVMPELPPAPIATQEHKLRLYACLGLLAAGVLGLLYINAERAWLPMMGGPFAQAYRRLKRLPAASTQAAYLVLHQAFNRTYGSSLFAADIPAFIAQHPRFAPLQADIEAFFQASAASLFAGRQSETENKVKAGLLHLCRQLRDCERRAR
ncbi:mxaA protein [Methylovorus glucosotrophus]|uniref:nonribosomal peptide synthetase MxaA n=1 Tax=Methylovorus glucosotrophus TaxID=266009 RepID=UPI0013319F14|nr:nonribosomal peptide synthetase MxaA [Methylovorus glucosotrophus]KAF0842791.1 mxaA protein [Methylovorus glucosotrophus]